MEDGSGNGGRIRRPTQTGAPTGHPGRPGRTPGSVPPARSDARFVAFSAVSVVVAGLLVAGALLLAVREDAGPRVYRPFQAGNAVELKAELREGGPFFIPDPFGGRRSILLALEDGDVVALVNLLPGTN